MLSTDVGGAVVRFPESVALAQFQNIQKIMKEASMLNKHYKTFGNVSQEVKEILKILRI